MRKDIIIVGSGGQGIQSMGKILARALDRKGFLVSLKSNYGPEARGGKSFTEVVIKETPDDWPEVLTVNILVAMSQVGYDAFIRDVAPHAQVFWDVDLVRPIQLSQIEQFAIPAVTTATKLGSQIAANMVMLGAVVGKTSLVPIEILKEIVDKKMWEAIESGYRAVKMLKTETPE